MGRAARHPQRHPLGTAHRRAVERPSASVRDVINGASSLPRMGLRRDLVTDRARSRTRPGAARRVEARRGVHRRHPRGCKKRGLCVARTRRGLATKIVAVADGNGLPIGVTIAEGTRGEASLVDETLAGRFCKRRPERLIGDKAYDSTKLDKALKTQKIELVSPLIRPRDGRKPLPTRRRQDGRALRRYRRRWKIERLWAWLLRSRRITTRYEVKAQNFLAFIHIACAQILVRRLVGL